MLSTKEKLIMAFRKGVDFTETIKDFFVSESQCIVIYIRGNDGTWGKNSIGILKNNPNIGVFEYIISYKDTITESLTHNEFVELWTLAENKYNELYNSEREKTVERDMNELDKFILSETV